MDERLRRGPENPVALPPKSLRIEVVLDGTACTFIDEVRRPLLVEGQDLFRQFNFSCALHG